MPIVCADISTSLFHRADAPQSTADFLKPNTPLVDVYVQVYDDATLIGVTAPHIMFDARGVKDLFAAWCTTLSGRLDSLPDGPRAFAPFVNLAREAENRASARGASLPPMSLRGWYRLGIFGIISWLTNHMMRVWDEGHEVSHIIWVPRKWLKEQKEECMREIERHAPGEWVSSNDVLTAVVVKVGPSASDEIRCSSLSLRRYVEEVMACSEGKSN